MIKGDEVYKIGILNKPHGIHGELAFTFTDDVFDHTDCEYIICLLDGIFVPFFIEEYRFRSETVALVKLEGINSTERARAFTNVEVYFPTKYIAKPESDSQSSVSAFIGFEIEDTISGTVGKIVDMDVSTINTLFVVESEKGELLIPVCEEFIVKLDYKHRRIQMSLPDGLVNLGADVSGSDQNI
ncbi:Ribosome maturation factor RimM [termite gut metagenome]|uniref:Ribosome maturation factor RimM n=1 Tax=termite gut metagenome TaxID=433724 RepID=A0A5J4RKQ9_9ZZZZ